MRITTIVVTSGLVVVVGSWAQDKPLTPRIAVGSGIAAVFLAVLGNVNEPFARLTAWGMLLTALLVYAVPMFTKLGVIKK